MTQLPLFSDPPQPRCRCPEREEVYLAVLALRRAGHRVYRAGRGVHLVDGRRIGKGKMLKRMAEAA